MCSGSEEGSYLKLKELCHHSTQGVRAIKKQEKKKVGGEGAYRGEEVVHFVLEHVQDEAVAVEQVSREALPRERERQQVTRAKEGESDRRLRALLIERERDRLRALRERETIGYEPFATRCSGPGRTR